MGIERTLMALVLLTFIATNYFCAGAAIEELDKGGHLENSAKKGAHSEAENEAEQKMIVLHDQSQSWDRKKLPKKIEAIQILEKLDDSFQLCVLQGGLKVSSISFIYKIIHSVLHNERLNVHGKMPLLTDPNCPDQVHRVSIPMEYKIRVNEADGDKCYTVKFVYYKSREQFSNYIHGLSFAVIFKTHETLQNHQISFNAGARMFARELNHFGVTLDLAEMSSELGHSKYNLALPIRTAKSAFEIAKESAKSTAKVIEPVARYGLSGAVQFGNSIGKSIWNRFNKAANAVDEPQHHQHSVDEHKAGEEEEKPKAKNVPMKAVNPTMPNSDADPESIEYAVPNPPLPESIGEGNTKMAKAEEQFKFCVKKDRKIEEMKVLYDLVEQLPVEMERGGKSNQLYVHQISNKLFGLSGKLFWARNRVLEIKAVPEESTETKACYLGNFECFKASNGSLAMSSRIINLRFILQFSEGKKKGTFKFQVGNKPMLGNEPFLQADELSEKAFIEVKKLEEYGITLNTLSGILDFSIAVYAKKAEDKEGNKIPELPESIVDPNGKTLKLDANEFQFCVATNKELVSHVDYLTAEQGGNVRSKFDVSYDMVYPVNGQIVKERVMRFQTNINNNSGTLCTKDKKTTCICVSGQFEYYSTGDVRTDLLANIRCNFTRKIYEVDENGIEKEVGERSSASYLNEHAGNSKDKDEPRFVTVDTLMTGITLEGGGL